MLSEYLSKDVFLQALYGVYAKYLHVRMACLTAVKCIPSVASRSLIQNVEVATSIWIALHDPEKVWLTNYYSQLCGVLHILFSFTLHI